MDIAKLALDAAMRNTGITPDDINNIRTLIAGLNELPGKLEVMQQQMNRIETKLDNLKMED